MLVRVKGSLAESALRALDTHCALHKAASTRSTGGTALARYDIDVAVTFAPFARFRRFLRLGVHCFVVVDGVALLG